MEKKEAMINAEEILKVEVEEISEEEVVATITIKEEVIISDKQAKKEVEIILSLLIEEAEEAIFIKKEQILIVFTMDSLDTKLQIAYSNE